MRTIRKIANVVLVLFVCFLTFIGCDDEGGLDVADNELVVQEVAQTDLPAAGGSGTITVVADQALEAIAADSWLTISVSGSIVTISAGENPNLTGRSTYVTIKAGTKSTIIAVTQYGVSVSKDAGDLKFGTDVADSLAIKFKSNIPVAFESSTAWISYSVQGDSVKVFVAKNSTGVPRKGYLRYALGNITDSIAVTQASINDYIGTWRIYGYNASGTLKAYSATIALGTDESTLIGSIAGFFSVNYTFDNGCIILSAGQQTGTYGSASYPIYLCLGSSSSGYLSWSSSVEFEASPSTMDNAIVFADNGSWSGYVVDEIYMYVFKASPPSSSTMYGTYLYLQEPFMIKQ
jgi:hypothetical protein